MPDPRQPQRRQPAPPQRGQPASHGSNVPGIHVGDPAAAARRAAPRPIRSLDPAHQPPPVEVERKIRKGETYWIVGPEEISKPAKAKIIRLSDEVGRQVLVEFEAPIGGVDKEGNPWGAGHDGGGLGKDGCCLYVRPDQVLDEKTMEAHKASVGEQPKKFAEFDELTVSPQAASPDRGEQVTIKTEDVGTISAEDLEEEEDDDK